jgi:hypothetical protein
MVKVKTESWLLKSQPPGELSIVVPKPEADLWWGVVREGARDLLYGHESVALDACEFLTTTGVWLCGYLWGVDSSAMHRELVRLVRLNPKLQRRVEEVEN